MKKYIVYISLYIAIAQTLSAQEALIQWTGTILDELMQPIPYAHVIVQKDFRGTSSDLQGKFTIITFPGDTLLISCIGYMPVKIPVPNFSHDDSRHFFRDIVLNEDPIMLRELIVFPWKTYREFREAFLALELPEDDLQRAYRNIAFLQERIYNAINSQTLTPNANFRDLTNLRTNRMMTLGHMYPTYAIANPIAWAQFFQALRNGDFRVRENTNKPPSVFEEIIQENTNR